MKGDIAQAFVMGFYINPIREGVGGVQGQQWIW